MITCDSIREASPEVVLGILDGAERADVVNHLASCATCREEVGRLTSVVDALGALAPPMEPSPGFEARALAEMGVGSVSARPRRGQFDKHRTRRVVAAVFAAAAIVVIVVAVIVLRPDDDTAFAGAAPMIGRSGQTVGEVTVEGTAEAQVSARVNYYGGRGEFSLEAVDRDGHIEVLGPMTFDGVYWQWSGIVADKPSDLVAFRVVSASGELFCEGWMPPAPD